MARRAPGLGAAAPGCGRARRHAAPDRPLARLSLRLCAAGCRHGKGHLRAPLSRRRIGVLRRRGQDGSGDDRGFDRCRHGFADGVRRHRQGPAGERHRHGRRSHGRVRRRPALRFAGQESRRPQGQGLRLRDPGLDHPMGCLRDGTHAGLGPEGHEDGRHRRRAGCGGGGAEDAPGRRHHPMSCRASPWSAPVPAAS